MLPLTSELAPEDLIWITAMNNKRPRSEEVSYIHLWFPKGQNSNNTSSEDKIWIRMREQNDGSGLYVLESQNVEGFDEAGPGYKLMEGKSLVKNFLTKEYKGDKLTYRYVPEKDKDETKDAGVSK